VRDVNIQYQKEMDKPVEYLNVRTAFGSGPTVRTKIVETFASSGYHVVAEDTLGPHVGREMTVKALWPWGLP